MKDPNNASVLIGTTKGTRTSVAPDEVGSDAFTFRVRTVDAAKHFEKAAAGTYKISVTVPVAPGSSTLKTINQNIIVTDSQSVLNVAKRDSVNVVTAATIEDAVNQAFEFTYNNVKLSTTATNAYEGKILVTDITVNTDPNKSRVENDGITKNTYINSIKVKVPVVLGDLNGDGTITDAADVVYIDQTASAGYFLAWK